MLKKRESHQPLYVSKGNAPLRISGECVEIEMSIENNGDSTRI